MTYTVFAGSKAGIVGSNPTQGMHVFLRLFCVCVVNGHATCWSPVQGVLPIVLGLRNWSETKYFTVCPVLQIASNRKERKKERKREADLLRAAERNVRIHVSWDGFYDFSIRNDEFHIQDFIGKKSQVHASFKRNSVRQKHKGRSRKERETFQISHGICCHSILVSGINCALMKTSRKALSHFSDGNWGISENIFVSLSLSLSSVSQLLLLLLYTITLILCQLSKCAMQKKKKIKSEGTMLQAGRSLVRVPMMLIF
jgi:hypothetical protein